MSLAEQYLIQSYGAYRDHYEWKAIESAFNEGYLQGKSGIHKQYNAQITLLENKIIELLDGQDPLKAKQPTTVLC